MAFDFSQTYLYKMHKLTSSLDAAFDRNLRLYSGIGLSQFTLLLSVQQHQPATQRTIATFLGISPGAISRQVELAQKEGFITVKSNANDRRSQTLSLTSSGSDKIKEGIKILEECVFDVFKDDNTQTNLMQHIILLQENIDQLKT